MASNAFSLGTLFAEVQLAGIKSFNRDLGKMESSVNAAFGNIQAAARTLAVGFGAVFTGGAAALTGATVQAAEFEAGLNRVRAVAQGTASEVNQIGELAARLGPQFGFGLDESLRAVEELARGGTTLRDALDGALNATLQLAAAGRIDLGSSADLMTDILQAFNLTAGQSVHVVDLLAGAANRSSTTVEEMTFALRQSMSVASVLQLPFDELATALGVLANVSLKGSDAGTSLRTMLLHLNPQTDKARKLMQELGIITEEGSNRFFDAAGNMQSMAEIAGVLQQTLAGMTSQQQTAALQEMFGQDAVRAAAAFFQTGADGVRAFEAALGGVKAADVAAIQIEGLSGQVNKLRAAIEAMMVEFGEPLLKPVTFVVKQLTEVARGFSALPESMQTILAWLIGGTTAVAGAGLAGALALMTLPGIVNGIGIVATALPRVAAGLAAFNTSQVAALAGPLGLGAVALGLGALVAIDFTEQKTERMRGTAAVLHDLNAALRGMRDMPTAELKSNIDNLYAALGALSGERPPVALQMDENVMALRRGLERMTAELDSRHGTAADVHIAARTLGTQITQGMVGTPAEPRGAVAAAKQTAESLSGLGTAVRVITETQRPAMRDLGLMISTEVAGPGIGGMEELRTALDPGLHDAAIDASVGLQAAAPDLGRAAVAVAAPVSTEFDRLRDHVVEATSALPAATEAALVASRSPMIRAWAALWDGLHETSVNALGRLGALFAVDIPDAFGRGFGGVLSLQDSFTEGWTKFTNALKKVWSESLGDMVSAFVAGFTRPIGEELGRLAARAAGILGTSTPATTAAGAVAAGTAAGAVNAATGAAGASTAASAGTGAAASIATVIGYGLAVEAVGQTLGALGITNFPTPSRIAGAIVQAFSGGGAVTGIGGTIPNGKVPEAAWLTAYPTLYVENRGAVLADTLHWAPFRLSSQTAIKLMYPVSRSGGTLTGRPVWLTALTKGNIVIPTDIGLELLVNGGITASTLGVDSRWLDVYAGKMLAVISEEGGLTFQDVAAPTPATTTAPSTPPPAPAAPAPAAPTGTVPTSYPQIQSLAQTFAQAVAVNLSELERDLSGQGVLTPTGQVSLSLGLAKVSHYLADQASKMGLALGSIPIPGAGITFGELFPTFAGGNFPTNAGALIQLNVDKFFGSDAELRQLTDEIIRIARQEGLVLNPII